MLNKLFGGKKDKESEAAAPPAAPSARLAPRTARVPQIKQGSVLRQAEDAQAAEQRAKATMAAVSEAVSKNSHPTPKLPESAGEAGEAAALFASDETKQAIDLLVTHLNKTSGRAPAEIWFMLMDAYQALNQQAAFEKSAALFAQCFKTSPPSWEPALASSKPQNVMGRNVLIVEGLPSMVHAEKLKDFVAASRETKQAKLDLSRARLDEDGDRRSTDLQMLLALMRRLRRYQVQTLLMGENQLVEVLRTVIQKDLVAVHPDLYWELLLEFLQWRGQEDAFDDLALAYARRFGKSAPGYDPEGVVAHAPDDVSAPTHVPADATLVPSEVIEDREMDRLCADIQSVFRKETSVRLNFHGVRRVTFDAGLALASCLSALDLNPAQVVVASPSQLVIGLFDITGVSGLVRYEKRRR